MFDVRYLWPSVIEVPRGLPRPGVSPPVRMCHNIVATAMNCRAGHGSAGRGLRTCDGRWWFGALWSRTHGPARGGDLCAAGPADCWRRCSREMNCGEGPADETRLRMNMGWLNCDG